MDRLIRALFVTDGRVTSGKVCEFCFLHITLGDTLDCEASIGKGECGLERLFPVWGTMAGKVHPFVFA